MIREQYRSTVIDATINIINSQIESVRNKNITKTSQRVYDNGFIGVAGAIGAYSEAELLQEAQEALNKKIEYPAEPQKDICQSLDKRQEIIPASSLVSEITELLQALRDRQPEFIFSNKVALTELQAEMRNDAGVCLEYRDRSILGGIIFKEKTSTSVFDGSLYFKERKYNRKLILDEFDLFLNAYREKVDFPGNGRYPVVFMTEESPIDKFVLDLKADVFSQGGSLFSGKLGQKLFNENFTFGQNLNPEETLMVPFFDAEGTVNTNYTFNLIENGVLMSPYCDKKSARKYGYAPTGSAAAAYDGVPQTALLRSSIKLCDKTLKELLGGQKGIVVLMAAGGDFTPSGDYATPVQLAMLFDGDRLLGRLPELNISSNVYDMFGPGFRGAARNSFLPFSTYDYTVLEMNVSL
ncbi:MAG: metallopeptidase TldD-related protein [Clostridia bacterium]|nr:metallopeptidase TldD-related protein [Clostridia bacterium]